MQSYGMRDVERVLQLSPTTVRSLIRSGFITPARAARGALRFSFQDLIVLRTARALIEAKVPRRRIHRALRELRRHLPESAPLSGLCIQALGDRVVVREGQSHWEAHDGQYLLGLEVGVDARGALQISSVSDRAAGGPARSTPAQIEMRAPEDAGTWFQRGLALEPADPTAALDAYQRALAQQPEHAGAWINRGRLLHTLGRTDEAEHAYRRGLERCGADPLLWFNLGVLLEDLGRDAAALDAYRSAIDADPAFADGHYNLARLYEQLGKTQHAIRHLGQYRRLTGEGRC